MNKLLTRSRLLRALHNVGYAHQLRETEQALNAYLISLAQLRELDRQARSTTQDRRDEVIRKVRVITD